MLLMPTPLLSLHETDCRHCPVCAQGKTLTTAWVGDSRGVMGRLTEQGWEVSQNSGTRPCVLCLCLCFGLIASRPMHVDHRRHQLLATFLWSLFAQATSCRAVAPAGHAAAALAAAAFCLGFMPLSLSPLHYSIAIKANSRA